MNIIKCWVEVTAINLNTDMLSVFDRFRELRDIPFLPVVDGHQKPVGVIRETDLKEYAYGRFGHDLVRRMPFRHFIRETRIVSSTATRDDLLTSAATNPNPDGLVIVENGLYRAILLNDVILKLFEQNRMETQTRLIQAQKMEALGTLAGGIAHDINNILTPILGYANLLLELHKSREPLDISMIEQIHVSALRARDTVGHILSFSREQKNERGPVSLSGLIREVIRLIKNSLPSTIEIEYSVTACNDLVLGNPAELHQILMNLCTNAFQAMKAGGGQLRLGLSDFQGVPVGWSLQHPLAHRQWLRLTVSDSGTGIPESILHKVFDPFFTTKPPNEGTGLGLAIVHGVVSRYNGIVSIETEVGKGTSVHIHFPRTPKALDTALDERTPLEAAPPLTSDTAAYPPIRVFYVDDDYTISKLAQKILSRFNMDVETENDSTKALALLDQHIEEFDVLVTDQIMPSISGTALAQHILDRNPDFPIIICTGYSEVVSPESLRQIGVRGLIHKPTDFHELVVLIRALLSKQGGPLVPSPAEPALSGLRVVGLIEPKLP